MGRTSEKQLWAIIESLYGQLKEEKKDNEILREILLHHLPELNFEN